MKLSNYIKMSSIRYWPSLILLILMILFPMNYKLVKIPLLVFALMIALYDIYVNKIKVSSSIWYFIAFYSIFGVTWSVIGVLNNQYDPLGFFRIYTLWPILLTFVFLAFYKYEKILFKTIIFSGFLISLMALNSILFALNLPFIGFLQEIDPSQVVGIHSGFTQLNANYIGSLFFIIPFTFIFSKKSDLKFSRVASFALIMQLVTAILSGRRMLIITSCLFICLFYIYQWIIKIKKNNVIYIACAFLVLTFVSIIIFISLPINHQFVQRLTFQGEFASGLIYRLSKGIELITSLSIITLFTGNGGGTLPFEIVYIKLFNEVGFLGIIMYFIILLMPIIDVLRKIKKDKISIIQIALISGYICQLLAMFSNPFESFDYIWTLVLPAVIIMRSKNESNGVLNDK